MKEKIIAKLILGLPLSEKEISALSDNEKGLSRKEEEIISEKNRRLERMCNGREFCVGCPHLVKVGKNRYGSCEEYVAVQMIIEARNK